MKRRVGSEENTSEYEGEDKGRYEITPERHAPCFDILLLFSYCSEYPKVYTCS